MSSWYILDPTNRIVAAGGDWDAFAEENDSPSAAVENVVGRSLEEYVSGLETQLYLSSLFQLCREAEAAHSFLYRCDAPWMARLFQMRVEPGDNPGELRVVHELIRSRAAAGGGSKEVIDVSEAEAEVSGAPRCSICNAVKLGDAWHDVYARPERKFFVSGYALCPSCAAHDAAREDRTMLRIFDAVPPALED
ncbi:MAG: hypothetical protein ACU0DT_10935 [Albimonas sp.]|uniref:hypothetical protein n=1 Tax=Albimonas sp. TaxID=1872425 RepID=UPI0040561F14|tara:strand:- start:125 stop:703 length:579 start_codon:yes stop_codon:yes gene_type:complete